MIITQEGAASADVSCGAWARRCAAAARCDGAGVVRAGADGRRAGRGGSGFVYIPMGVNMAQWTPPGRGR